MVILPTIFDSDSPPRARPRVPRNLKNFQHIIKENMNSTNLKIVLEAYKV